MNTPKNVTVRTSYVQGPLRTIPYLPIELLRMTFLSMISGMGDMMSVAAPSNGKSLLVVLAVAAPPHSSHTAHVAKKMKNSLQKFVQNFIKEVILSAFSS